MLSFAAACGGSSTEPVVPPRVIAGTWQGNVTVGSSTQTLNVTLWNASGVLTGTALLGPTSQGVMHFTVTGAFRSPRFSAFMVRMLGDYPLDSYEGTPPIHLEGTVSTDNGALNATMTGYLFTGESVTLVKQL